jgi:hypothetical protein
LVTTSGPCLSIRTILGAQYTKANTAVIGVALFDPVQSSREVSETFLNVPCGTNVTSVSFTYEAECKAQLKGTKGSVVEGIRALW